MLLEVEIDKRLLNRACAVRPADTAAEVVEAALRALVATARRPYRAQAAGADLPAGSRNLNGAAIIRRRRALGLSQAGLGLLLGRGQRAIAQWETGRGIDRPEVIDLALRYFEHLREEHPAL